MSQISNINYRSQLFNIQLKILFDRKNLNLITNLKEQKKLGFISNN